MRLANTRTAYGWMSISLHWISAGGVLALYLLGERMEEASDGRQGWPPGTFTVQRANCSGH